MIKCSSFSLTIALLGLLVVILPFLGLPTPVKTISFVLLGGLIILFALADAGHVSSSVERFSGASSDKKKESYGDETPQ